jgi:hypothetical protein
MHPDPVIHPNTENVLFVMDARVKRAHNNGRIARQVFYDGRLAAIM